jgi:hypothetical protein
LRGAGDLLSIRITFPFLFVTVFFQYTAVQPTTPEGKQCARLLELAARETDKIKKTQLDISEKVSPEKARALAVALAKDPAYAGFKWLKLNVYYLGDRLAEVADILCGAPQLESIRYSFFPKNLLAFLIFNYFRFRMFSLVDKNQSIDTYEVLAGEMAVKQTDAGAYAIARLIQTYAFFLHVSHSMIINPLNRDHLKLISVLFRNQNLKEISIAHCEYKGEALQHILSAIATHKSLTNVNLKTNSIKDVRKSIKIFQLKYI